MPPTGEWAAPAAAAWGGVLPHATDEKAAPPAVKLTAQMTTAGTSLSRRSVGRLERPATWLSSPGHWSDIVVLLLFRAPDIWHSKEHVDGGGDNLKPRMDDIS